MAQQKTYTIEDFHTGLPATADVSAFGDDYVIANLRAGELSGYSPVLHLRFAGFLFLFVRRGKLSVGFDNQDFTAGEGTVFAIPPTITARICSDNWDKAELTAAYMSREFLQTLNFSLSAFSGPVVIEHSAPVCHVLPDDAEILDRYLNLLSMTARKASYPKLMRHCASNLCVAMLYHCIAMFMRQLEISGTRMESRNQKTRNTHVRNFIRMVHANFTSERSVSYYASELCVSPKYLSALVKEATGRTAARWIEDYVIMEAKNLLRYSGKNVQQVAYALNFANQSAFGKYFKHLTGMSPTEFLKS